VENAYLAEEKLPNIQFFFVPDCAHQCQTDQPQLFNDVFVEFFRDGRLTRETAGRAGVSKNRPELPGLVADAVGTRA
jgi:hypothetical protein